MQSKSPPSAGGHMSPTVCSLAKSITTLRSNDKKSLYKCVLANKNRGCRILKHLKANILPPELYKILI